MYIKKKYKKIYCIGDSHSNTLYGMSLNVLSLAIGPVTMHCCGHDKIDAAFDSYYIPNNRVEREGLWVLAFGEIDVRCHIYNQIHLSGRDEDEVLITLVDNFFENNKDIHPDIAIMSIVPPVKFFTGDYIPTPETFPKEWPVIGPDDDRSRYTKKLNTYIKQKCDEYNFLYIDVYSLYSDEDGFLIKELSDGSVHIRDNTKVYYLIKDLDILEQL